MRTKRFLSACAAVVAVVSVAPPPVVASGGCSLFDAAGDISQNQLRPRAGKAVDILDLSIVAGTDFVTSSLHLADLKAPVTGTSQWYKISFDNGGIRKAINVERRARSWLLGSHFARAEGTYDDPPIRFSVDKDASVITVAVPRIWFSGPTLGRLGVSTGDVVSIPGPNNYVHAFQEDFLPESFWSHETPGVTIDLDDCQ